MGKLTITRQDEAPEDGDIMTRLMSVKYEGEVSMKIKITKVSFRKTLKSDCHFEKILSLAATEVVNMTASDALIDAQAKITTYPFR